jgi:hypothetical protein
MVESGRLVEAPVSSAPTGQSYASPGHRPGYKMRQTGQAEGRSNPSDTPGHRSRTHNVPASWCAPSGLLEGVAGHLALRQGKSLEFTGPLPTGNHTAPDRPPTRRISLALAPAFPPMANEKRRPPAQSPSHRGRNRSKQKELPKGSPLVLGSVAASWGMHSVSRSTESPRMPPHCFKLGVGFRV